MAVARCNCPTGRLAGGGGDRRSYTREGVCCSVVDADIGLFAWCEDGFAAHCGAALILKFAAYAPWQVLDGECVRICIEDSDVALFVWSEDDLCYTAIGIG